MTWLQLTVSVHPDIQGAVETVLHELTPGGIQLVSSDQHEQVELITFFPQDEASSLLEQLQAALDRMDGRLQAAGIEVDRPVITTRERVDDDWLLKWREFFEPQEIGRRWLVIPAWRQARINPGQLPIVLEPGLAFGTGEHASTRLVLLLLEQLEVENRHLLDVGTGSGILAIAANRLQAASVTAIDIDQQAVSAARDNLRRNGFDPSAVVQADIAAADRLAEHGLPQRFELVLANLTAEVLSDQAIGLADVCAPGGRLVASGIISGSAERVEADLAHAGFIPEKRRDCEEWTALVLRRSEA